MQISIVVPAYNAAKYLRETVESVLRQTFSDWELLVINDGSTDETSVIALDYVSKDNRIRLLNFPNGGLATARNRGLENATPDAPYVLFLDADDLLEPNALETLWKILIHHPEFVAAHGEPRFIGSKGETLDYDYSETKDWTRTGIYQNQLFKFPHEVPTNFAMFAYRCIIWTAGQVLIRKSCLEKIDKFDPAINSAADWDMWIRLTLLGDMAYIPQVVVGYRRHDNNMSSNYKLMRTHEMAVRRKTLNSLRPLEKYYSIHLRGCRIAERETAVSMLKASVASTKERRYFVALKLLRRGVIDFFRVWK